MKLADFDVLVRRIERRYEGRPWALKAAVALLVVLGYIGFVCWFSVMLLLGLAAIAGAVVLQSGASFFLAILGGFLIILGILQAGQLMWVPLEPPQGRELHEHEAPRFMQIMRELREQLKSVRVHQVLINYEFNAGIQQIPRLGVFGWPKNFLYVGLPLLECLTTDEFRAVLAHEFVHLSAQHGRFGAWIYRLRARWDRVFLRLHQMSAGSVQNILRRGMLAYIDRFWPRFNAHAFVLSRANEYRADADAARVAGAGALVSALWRMECICRFVEERFWFDWWQQANREPQPPAGAMRQLRAAMQTLPDPSQAERWMEQARRRMTDNADTHPSLQDRIAALRFDASAMQRNGFPTAPAQSAADELLGASLEPIRADVEQLWQKSVEKNWRDRHFRAHSLQDRVSKLQEHVPDPECDPATLWEKICAVVQLEGPSAAESALRRLLELRPSHAGANFILGRHLLEQGKSEGESLLRRILNEDEEELIPGACEVLASHFRHLGETESLRVIVARLDQYNAALKASQQERSSVSASDSFLEHGLQLDEVAALVSELVDHPELDSAWLVRKSLQHFPKQRLFVLCVRSKANWLGFSNSSTDLSLAAVLARKLKLPGRLFVFAPLGGFRKLGKKVMRSNGSLVFDRRQWREVSGAVPKN